MASPRTMVSPAAQRRRVIRDLIHSITKNSDSITNDCWKVQSYSSRFFHNRTIAPNFYAMQYRLTPKFLRGSNCLAALWGELPYVGCYESV